MQDVWLLQWDRLPCSPWPWPRLLTPSSWRRKILCERDKDFANPEGRTMGRSGTVSGEFLRELAEERKKGALRTTLQQYAMSKWGPVSAIVAGWAYDGQISAATIHNVVTASLQKELVSLSMQTLSKQRDRKSVV